MKWAQACYDSERARAIYLYDMGKLTLISHTEAKEELAKLKENCPDGYIEYCEGCSMSDYCPTVEEYKKYKQYEKDQMNHWLAVMPLNDWLVGERGLL